MQSQSSSAAAKLQPEAPAQPPAVVIPPPKKSSGGRGKWIAGLLLIAAIAGAVFLWRSQATKSEQTAESARLIRTARVTVGPLNATIRVTGATVAENFVSLITPLLRGSRADTGRDRATVTAAAPLPSLAAGASNASSGSNLSSALRASTTRLSTAPAATAAASSSTAATPSATLGPDGTGSTAAAIPGNGPGGGGGGGADFMLVLQKLIKPGSHVKKGEVVAEFDRQYMLNRIDDYHTSVIQTEASLIKLKADLAITRHAHQQSISKAKGTLEKARLDMKTVPVLSAIDAEKAKLALQEADARFTELAAEEKLVEASLGAQIRNAEIDLQQTRIELKRAQANAEKMIVKASIDGLTVMQTLPRGGELGQVQQGDQTYPGIFFMSIVDTRSMIVNAMVNQADVEHLRIGAKARVHFDAYPDLELPAKVYSVGGIAKPGGMRATFVKEIPIKLKLEAMDPRVIPDLSVSADVVIDSEPQQAAIAPLSSIFNDGDGKPPYVLVQTPEGWTRREVQLGVANFTSVAVRSGLKENEIIAAERPPGSNPGTQ
jgi:HlyD family secretion protein